MHICVLVSFSIYLLTLALSSCRVTSAHFPILEWNTRLVTGAAADALSPMIAFSLSSINLADQRARMLPVTEGMEYSSASSVSLDHPPVVSLLPTVCGEAVSVLKRLQGELSVATDQLRSRVVDAAKAPPVTVSADASLMTGSARLISGLAGVGEHSGDSALPFETRILSDVLSICLDGITAVHDLLACDDGVGQQRLSGLDLAERVENVIQAMLLNLTRCDRGSSVGPDSLSALKESRTRLMKALRVRYRIAIGVNIYLTSALGLLLATFFLRPLKHVLQFLATVRFVVVSATVLGMVHTNILLLDQWSMLHSTLQVIFLSTIFTVIAIAFFIFLTRAANRPVAVVFFWMLIMWLHFGGAERSDPFSARESEAEAIEDPSPLPRVLLCEQNVELRSSSLERFMVQLPFALRNAEGRYFFGVPRCVAEFSGRTQVSGSGKCEHSFTYNLSESACFTVGSDLKALPSSFVDATSLRAFIAPAFGVSSAAAFSNLVWPPALLCDHSVFPSRVVRLPILYRHRTPFLSAADTVRSFLETAHFGFPGCIVTISALDNARGGAGSSIERFPEDSTLTFEGCSRYAQISDKCFGSDVPLAHLLHTHGAL